MALVVKDRVRQTTTTSGVGTVTLSGTAPGFQSFEAVGNGNETYYCIVSPTTGAWEVGKGTYLAAGTTLSRNVVLSSSNNGMLVNFDGNLKDVFCTYPADQAVTLGDVQTLTNKTLTSPVITSPTGITKADVGLGNVTNDAQLKIASNLGDLNNAATARGNLGLGTAATATVVTSDTDVTAGRLITTVAGPAQAFRQGNILGTVSQSGGVPTGAIIERGSNANGEFVKYADGTMICSGSVNLTGSIPSTGQESGTVTLPASFSTTIAAFFIVGLGPNNVATTVVQNNLASVSSGAWILRNESGATRTYQIDSFFAVGRWF